MTTTLIDTKTELTVTEFNQGIKGFIDLFKQGVEAWRKAGALLVKLIDSDPHAYDYILAECPSLNANILSRFEDMGRGKLHPNWLISNAHAANKIQRLPYNLQEQLLDQPVPMVVHTDNGTDILLVQAKNMTQQQANQVFATGRIRTEGEQKAWLVEQESKQMKNVSPPQPSQLYTIKGGKVIINGVEFTRKQLTGILLQLD